MDFLRNRATLAGRDTREERNIRDLANHAKPSKSARRQDPPLPKIGFQTICPIPSQSLSILSNPNTLWAMEMLGFDGILLEYRYIELLTGLYYAYPPV